MEDQDQKTHNELWEAINFITQNHIEHLKEDVSEIKISLAKHGADLEWLKKTLYVVATASVGSFFAAMFNLLTK